MSKIKLICFDCIAYLSIFLIKLGTVILNWVKRKLNIED